MLYNIYARIDRLKTYKKKKKCFRLQNLISKFGQEFKT